MSKSAWEWCAQGARAGNPRLTWPPGGGCEKPGCFCPLTSCVRASASSETEVTPNFRDKAACRIHTWRFWGFLCRQAGTSRPAAALRAGAKGADNPRQNKRLGQHEVDEQSEEFSSVIGNFRILGRMKNLDPDVRRDFRHALGNIVEVGRIAARIAHGEKQILGRQQHVSSPEASGYIFIDG